MDSGAIIPDGDLKALAKRKTGLCWNFFSLPHTLYSVELYATLAGHTARTLQLYSRVAMLTAYFTGIVIITSYSASLLSHVMTSTDELPISGFRDLLDEGSYRLGVMHHSAHVVLQGTWTECFFASSGLGYDTI